MLKTKILGDGEKTAIFVHGFRGNINSLTSIADAFENCRKIFVEGPIQISTNEYAWFTDSNLFEVEKSIHLLNKTVDTFLANDKSKGIVVYVGFSQGASLLSSSIESLQIDHLVLLCPKFREVRLHDLRVKRSKFFCYLSLDDKIVPPEEGIEGFKSLCPHFNDSILVTGYSDHKISSNCFRRLLQWAKEI